MSSVHIDKNYLVETLFELLHIPSPSGYTDLIVHKVGEKLEELGIPFELTRRGAIRARMGTEKAKQPHRALVAHLDTTGAMVREVKANGRLAIVPVGSWSSRFAEGGRVTVFTTRGSHRGTILPLLASGHTYNLLVDTQPTTWEQTEIRLDEKVCTAEDVRELAIDVGDYVALDPLPEINKNGFINSRHLDNKAGVAVVLTAAKWLLDNKVPLPVKCFLLFTIFEEVGSGASSILHGEVAEMVSVDNNTVAPNQNSSEYGVTIAMMDSSGPFDYHLNKKLMHLCETNAIPFTRDVFKYYRCDSASAIEAGNDIRSSLVCFGVDGSHGYERTHMDSLASLAELLTYYVQSPLTFARDRMRLAPLEGFSTQPDADQVLVKEAPEGFLVDQPEGKKPKSDDH